MQVVRDQDGREWVQQIVMRLREQYRKRALLADQPLTLVQLGKLYKCILSEGYGE